MPTLLMSDAHSSTAAGAGESESLCEEAANDTVGQSAVHAVILQGAHARAGMMYSVSRPL